MGEKDVGAGAASEGIVVLGEASEATVHGGTVRWRRRRWRWSGAMGAERETRRGANVLYNAVTDCTVHMVRLTLVTGTCHLD